MSNTGLNIGEIGQIWRMGANRRKFVIFQFVVINNYKIRNLAKFHWHTYMFLPFFKRGRGGR